MTLPMQRAQATRATLATLLACATPAHATPVTLTFTDAAGQPVADAVVMLEATAAKPPVKPMATVEISQAKRQFNPQLTVITVGTPVTFPNFDTVRHHVYSFSPVKTFELKLYAGVPNAPIVFDKPGAAVLGCNIHDSMAAWVLVLDTPWYARSDAAGKARIDNVPAGAYRMRLWHAGMSPATEPAPQALTVGAAALELAAKLAVSATP